MSTLRRERSGGGGVLPVGTDASADPLLAVDPIACDAHGFCAELVPERITLDEWGYPIISGDPVDRALLEHARRAVAACPTLALKLRAARR